ncbi:hypothetical protein K438DRAFT_1753583 [Mycena galopus ATCC 62051]|nr:hypothetical protein K438DRAFT_1753583 [Mycena galopus ATCC 62051]
MHKVLVPAFHRRRDAEAEAHKKPPGSHSPQEGCRWRGVEEHVLVDRCMERVSMDSPCAANLREYTEMGAEEELPSIKRGEQCTEDCGDLEEDADESIGKFVGSSNSRATSLCAPWRIRAVRPAASTKLKSTVSCQRRLTTSERESAAARWRGGAGLGARGWTPFREMAQCSGNTQMISKCTLTSVTREMGQISRNCDRVLDTMISILVAAVSLRPVLLNQQTSSSRLRSAHQWPTSCHYATRCSTASTKEGHK